jgi:hypothetical protein
MMRVVYGMAKGNANRYRCRGDDAHVGARLCIGIGGVQIDRAVALQILEAVSDRAVEAAIFASDQVERSRKEIVAAVEQDVEAARYDTSLASRRYKVVDPAKRHVARELEARWNGALEHVAGLEIRIEELSAMSAARLKMIALACFSLPAISRRYGTHLQRRREPSSGSSIFWFRKSCVNSTTPPTKPFCWFTGVADAIPRFESRA